MLKERLVARPVLALHNAEAAIEVHTDACKLGLGGILLQHQSDGSWRPVAVAPIQKNRHITAMSW